MNRSNVDTTKLDRLPPHSIEAEQGTLGCVLLSPNESMGICVDKLKAGPEMFYDLRHQTLFEILTRMYDARDPIDLITVGQRLRDAHQLDAIGGLAYLSALQDATPSAANLSYYLEIVVEKSTLRRVMAVCCGAIARIYDEPDNVARLLDDVERDVLAIGDQLETAGAEATGREMAGGFIDDLEARMRGEIKRTPSGFPNLDSNLRGGFKPGQFVVVAGRPGAGKSAFALNLAVAVAAAGIPTGIFSLEMSVPELRDRIVSGLAGVDVGRFDASHRPTEAEHRLITVANAKLNKLPIRIDDRAGRTIGQIQSISRRWKARHGVGLVIIDYLQLLTPGHGQGKDRREQVDAISRGLKLLAKELGIPVIVAAQLNRDIERDKGRKPRLSDLRESGAIEQDADVVGMLYDPRDSDAPETNPHQPREVRLLVAKNRNGQAGADLRFTFSPTLTRFDVYSPIPHDL